jgi:hypothetical protein
MMQQGMDAVEQSLGFEKAVRRYFGLVLLVVLLQLIVVVESRRLRVLVLSDHRYFEVLASQ